MINYCMIFGIIHRKSDPGGSSELTDRKHFFIRVMIPQKYLKCQ
jgi:hypothetical protein